MCITNWNSKWYSHYEKHVVPQKLKHKGNSLAVQWLGLGAFTAGAQVQSLVRELRSHRPHIQSKKKKKIKHRITMILEELKSLLLKVKALRVKKLA